MSSTNKTNNLKLNNWIGSDKPMRVDFNYDNEVIDRAITEHTSDDVVHINDEERNKWNNYIHIGVYFGDGSSTRDVATDCPFDANFGIVFAVSRPPSVFYSSESKKYNYIGFFSQYGESSGVKLLSDLKTITVSQSSQSIISKEYMNLNEIGVSYVYIIFR